MLRSSKKFSEKILDIKRKELTKFYGDTDKTMTDWVEVVKASLDLTGKYPNTNKGRIGFLDECN